MRAWRQEAPEPLPVFQEQEQELREQELREPVLREQEQEPVLPPEPEGTKRIAENRRRGGGVNAAWRIRGA